MFTPDLWGFMIQFDEHIFQMGWFNDQLVYIYIYVYNKASQDVTPTIKRIILGSVDYKKQLSLRKKAFSKCLDVPGS